MERHPEMCGRYTISATQEVLESYFAAEFSETHIPLYNASPGQHLPVILDASPGTIQPALWGMRPDWEATPGRLLINARAETVHLRATFRDSLRRRRCLVIADGFYEWQAIGGTKQPYRIVLNTGEPFAFAGIWRKTQGESVFVILTTDANKATRPIHDRMPVILERREFGGWLDRDLPVEDVMQLLDPYPEDTMTAYKVSKAVNVSTNESPGLIEPATG